MNRFGYVASGLLVGGILVWGAGPARGQGEAGDRRAVPSRAQLETWLRQYPAADADGDGVLTVAEARAYEQQRRQNRRPRPALQPDFGFRTQFTFATMSDGVKIALAVGFPAGFDPQDTTRKWPAMLNMMGYSGSTVPEPPQSYGDRYVTVRASLRGAGASGGSIQAISPRNGQDGFEIIENWIVRQPWSNGRVALHGHSWSGLTGFMIAATNPPHLKAVAVSGLLDDVYRDIGRIGGIRNAGFPVDWTVQLYAPEGPFRSGTAAVEARGLSAAEYREIVASRPPMDFSRSLLWQLLTAREVPAEARAASPGTHATGVRAPIHIMHAYQDEQTGPSGVWLWTYVPDDVPKRLILSNGDHGDVGRFQRDRLRWLDFWTLADGQPDSDEFCRRDQRVHVHFETPRHGASVNEPLVGADFPLPDTVWTRYFLQAEGGLATTPPDSADTDSSAGDDYLVTPVPTAGGPDGQTYLLAPAESLAICGPIAVTLWARCSAVDTDFCAALVDVDPAGTRQLLQRGLLRASHRQLDDQRSRYVEAGDQKLLVRPRHTHRQPQPVVPYQPCQFEIEIFPVGHVVRPGHRLGLWIGQPPARDPVTRSRDGEPTYCYESAPPRGKVTILRSARYPSSVLLPVLPQLPPLATSAPQPGAQAGVYVY